MLVYNFGIKSYNNKKKELKCIHPKTFHLICLRSTVIKSERKSTGINTESIEFHYKVPKYVVRDHDAGASLASTQRRYHSTCESSSRTSTWAVTTDFGIHLHSAPEFTFGGTLESMLNFTL